MRYCSRNIYMGYTYPIYILIKGYEQLRLLLGNVSLEDQNGDLIQIEITHIQLQVGTLRPSFSLPYHDFAKGTDWTWITAIWKHMHQLRITIEVADTWTQPLMQQHDLIVHSNPGSPLLPYNT